MVLSSSRGTRVQTASLVQDASGPENDREVHSSPPVVSTKKRHSLSPLKYRLENIRLHKTDLCSVVSFFSNTGVVEYNFENVCVYTCPVYSGPNYTRL